MARPLAAGVSAAGSSYTQARPGLASSPAGRPPRRAGTTGLRHGRSLAQAPMSSVKSGKKPKKPDPNATRVSRIDVAGKKAILIDPQGGDDTVHVRQLKNGKLRVDINGGKSQGGETIIVDPKATPEVVINGGRGRDTIVVDSNVKTGLILDGGPGRDTDYITGGGGKDLILGGEGDDVLTGSFSNQRQDGDVIITGPGRDEIHGRDGRDVKDFDPSQDQVRW
jgi:Ca2+-binding RTX toxin-like protein